MADFTVNRYTQLLHTLIEQDYSFQTFRDFLSKPADRTIILRHDVDKRPQNSLVLAKIESALGLKGTYYFRARSCSWNESIIKEIARLGHEIGYHYEDLSTHHGDYKKAFEDFKQNLEELRKLVIVSTISMHGSPRSKYDSRELWKLFDYKDQGLIGEPYLDVDFTKVLYLTDTGRRWNSNKVSVRDKVDDTQAKLLFKQGYFIRSTKDILKAAAAKALPNSILFNIHPQRWHDNKILWFKEFIFQNVKNVAKRVLLLTFR